MMMTQNDSGYDVVIAGAGPTGCMTAMNAPDGMRILLLDSSPLPRDVICGGILSGWSSRLLAPHRPPASIFCEPRTLTWRLHDLTLNRTGTLSGDSYLNVERSRFDAWLLDLAAARRNVDIWPKARFMSVCSIGPGRVSVRIGLKGKDVHVGAGFLVGADGATSAVRRTIGVRPEPARWITIQQVIQGAHDVRQMEAFICPGVDFYGWVIPKGDELVVGAGFDPSLGRLRSRFDAFRDMTAERVRFGGDLVGKPRGRMATRLRRPAEICTGMGNVMLAGEAAGLISPWSGEGIGYALFSGKAVAEALTSSDPRKAYDRAIRRMMPWVLTDIACRKVMKRPWRRLAAATLYPTASLRRDSQLHAIRDQ